MDSDIGTGSRIRPIWRDSDGCVVMLDQTKLPHEEVYHRYATAAEVAEAIQTMVIRGAPAIGVAAAMGLALGAGQLAKDTFQVGFDALCESMAATRPTAVNLFWAIDRMKEVAASETTGSHREMLAALDAKAWEIFEEDIAINRTLGSFGGALIPDGARVLTHCNTGSLATAGYGTALGCIRAAVAGGKKIAVLADETRPYLQGSRLTAWECIKDGIDVTVIADSAAGFLMSRGEIDVAIVGADRVVANGDAANKIGTYQVATMCQRHGLPFYVAAPISTIDLSISDGDSIPIEQRSADEVRQVHGHPIAPTGVKVLNPAFDVTPAELITAIITERGIARPPYRESLLSLVNSTATG